MLLTKEFVKENRGKIFNIEFKEPVRLVISNRYEMVKKTKLKFFLSGNDYICYMTTRCKSTGYRAEFSNENIQSLTMVEKKDKDVTLKSNAKKILNRIHENAWLDIKEKMKKIIDGSLVFGEGEYIEDFIHTCKFRSLKEFIPKYEQEIVLEKVKNAFENKTNYSWRRNSMSNKGRDFSLECKMTDDGKFYAWFQSEFAGCGNGDYYLLINPTTVMFYERD